MDLFLFSQRVGVSKPIFRFFFSFFFRWSCSIWSYSCFMNSWSCIAILNWNFSFLFSDEFPIISVLEHIFYVYNFCIMYAVTILLFSNLSPLILYGLLIIKLPLWMNCRFLDLHASLFSVNARVCITYFHFFLCNFFFYSS